MFDGPLIIVGPAIIGSLSLTALCGLLLVRRYVLPRLRVKEADSEFSGAVVQSIMVFYGLALALIAVNVWQTYNDVSQTVSLEAITFATLYRDWENGDAQFPALGDAPSPDPSDPDAPPDPAMIGQEKDDEDSGGGGDDDDGDEAGRSEDDGDRG